MMYMERNIQFAILQTIAIIFVVVGHSGGISFGFEWFPISSFHIPLFIFISGYFYKEKQEKKLISTFLFSTVFDEKEMNRKITY